LIRKIENCEIFLKFSFDKNKTQAQRKDFLKKFSKKFINKNYSHSNGATVLAWTKNNIKIGIDMEPLNRHISKNLLKKLKAKSESLGISAIQLWCLMEAAYKSNKEIQDLNFLNYSFERKGSIFRLLMQDQKITCKIYTLKCYTYALALSR